MVEIRGYIKFYLMIGTKEKGHCNKHYLLFKWIHKYDTGHVLSVMKYSSSNELIYHKYKAIFAYYFEGLTVQVFRNCENNVWRRLPKGKIRQPRERAKARF